MIEKHQISDIPSEPGVYFFKNKRNKILYIGKAKNLKKRVSSYFLSSSSSVIKNTIITQKANFVDYFVVRDEVEALITEANMIREYKPKYNVVLKDDKSFPYITITKDSYPRIIICRRKEIEKYKSIHFGPYTNASYLRNVIKILHKVLPLKACDSIVDKNFVDNNRRFKGKTCFCGFCMNTNIMSVTEYKSIIESVIDYLRGKSQTIECKITELMRDSSNKLKFEEASRHRDNLNAIKTFSKKQKRISNDFNNYDIIHNSFKKSFGMGLVMRVRNGLLIGTEKFELYGAEQEFEKSINDFLIQYYKKTQDIPSEIIINCQLNNSESFKKWIHKSKGKRTRLIFPKIGNKKKMLDMCIKNTDLSLKNLLIQKIKRGDYIPKILSELKNALSLEKIPKVIEAFDNSNIQGSNPVAGMVCFKNGKPYKKSYRKYNIKTVDGIDDFKSMEEIIFRRYDRLIKEKKELPDLILIDGGKGQLSSAKKSLDRLSLNHIPVIGLAKKLEEVYLPNMKSPQNISKTSPALYLLRTIRDEVHRFAISFHRNKRSKDMIKSNIRQISGIGEKTFIKLFKTYKTTDNIKSKSALQISKETGISLFLSNEILKVLKPK